MRRDHLRNEAAYLPDPRSVEDLAELRRRIIAAGHSAPVANGLVGWLVSKAAGEPDSTGNSTRSQYRKILAELPVEGPAHPTRQLEIVGSEPAAAPRRRAARGTRRLSAVVFAVAVALGAGTHPGGSQGHTEASGGSSGAAGAGCNRRESMIRRRSVKSGRKAA